MNTRRFKKNLFFEYAFCETGVDILKQYSGYSEKLFFSLSVLICFLQNDSTLLSFLSAVRGLGNH